MSKSEIMDKAFNIVGTPFIRLFENTRGYTALLSDGDAQKIVRKENVSALREAGLEVVPPPDFRAKRSVFVRGLDPLAGGRSPAETREELTRVNPWMGVEEVIKIKNYTHVLKIVFETIECADRVLSDGFLLFSMRVSPDQVKRDVFIPLLTCFTCFRFEDHPTHQCPDKGGEVKCSECAGAGHSWRECRSEAKKCINCGGPHRTLAMACPVKKRAIEAKKREMERVGPPTSVGGPSYSSVAAAAAPMTPQVTREEQLKIATIVAHSVQHEQRYPGQYAVELNRMLEANGFPTIKFPKRRPALAELGRGGTQTSEMTAASEQSGQGFISDGLSDQPEITISHSRGVSGGRDSVSSVQYTPGGSSTAGGESLERRHSVGAVGSKGEPQLQISTTRLVPVPDAKGRVFGAAASGIRLFVSRDAGLAEPTWGTIRKYLKEGTIKFEHTLNYPDEVVERLISGGHVQFTRENFVGVDAGTLRKKRNGNPRKSSPPGAKSAKTVGGHK